MKGETIKYKLSLLGKTQKQLAELLGVTPQAIYEILSASDVRSSSIEKIARAIGVPISFFFEEASHKRTTFNFRKEFVKNKGGYSDGIGNKVRALLKEQDKKLIGLCEYVGITDAGLRKIFERDNCSVSILLKISEYFGVNISYFLPQYNVEPHESSKDREIEYLKGQIKAYEKALRSLTSFSNEAKLPKLSVG